MALELLVPAIPRLLVQDSNTARNLYIYLRDPHPETTPRVHIRHKLATVNKSLALRLERLLKILPNNLQNQDNVIRHVHYTMPLNYEGTKTPPTSNKHHHAPSIKTPLHQLKPDGDPHTTRDPMPCFLMAHANHWVVTICTKFTNDYDIYVRSIHSHCPTIPYPALKYVLTIDHT